MDESLEKIISDTPLCSKEILLHNYLQYSEIIAGTPIIKIKKIMAKLIRKTLKESDHC